MKYLPHGQLTGGRKRFPVFLSVLPHQVFSMLELLQTACYSRLMTEYRKYTTIKPANAPLLTDGRVKEAKEARRKLLEQVEQRRAENYKRFLEKQRLQSKQPVI
jgi:hypothetical protein